MVLNYYAAMQTVYTFIIGHTCLLQVSLTTVFLHISYTCDIAFILSNTCTVGMVHVANDISYKLCRHSFLLACTKTGTYLFVLKLSLSLPFS